MSHAPRRALQKTRTWWRTCWACLHTRCSARPSAWAAGSAARKRALCRSGDPERPCQSPVSSTARHANYVLVLARLLASRGYTVGPHRSTALVLCLCTPYLLVMSNELQLVPGSIDFASSNTLSSTCQSLHIRQCSSRHVVSVCRGAVAAVRRRCRHGICGGRCGWCWTATRTCRPPATATPSSLPTRFARPSRWCHRDLV